MGSKKWNPERWHRMGPKHYHSTWRPSSRPRTMVATALLAALMVAGGAVAMAGTAPAQSDKVGICHATGSDEKPYVFLIVDRDGMEHGHHATHHDDLVDVASEAACLATETSTTSTASEATCLGPETQVEEPAAEAPPALTEEAAGSADQGTETSDSAAPAETEAAPEEAESDEAAAPTENETEAEPPLVCEADAALTTSGEMVGSQVRMVFLVASLGPEEANEVHLDVELPDVGKPWQVSGTGAGDCGLANRTLACDFDDLVAGETRSVEAIAPRCPDDCGEDLSAEGILSAYNDLDPTNNEGIALVVIPDCGEGTETAPPVVPEPTNESEEPQNATPPAGNGTEPAPNETAPPSEEPANETQNGTPPAGAPQADLRLLQAVDQDDEQVVLRLRLENRGPADALNVALQDDLPDVRRAWFLGGADATDCTLEGRSLRCWFGDLGPEENRTIVLKAYTDRLPCGEHRTNTVVASADNEAVPANNQASAGIQARAC